jgi:hypothetical protein
MLKFEVHLDDLPRQDWDRRADGWYSGRSWIRPVVHPVLESFLLPTTDGGTLVVVRERDRNTSVQETGLDKTVTAAQMQSWSGDYLVLDLNSDRIMAHAGVLGTVPLLVASRSGVLAGSWNLADLRRWFDPGSLSDAAVTRAMIGRPMYGAATAFNGVHRVTERSTAVLTRAGVQVHYPEPAEHVLAARELAYDTDAVEVFEAVLDHVMRRLPVPSGSAAIELSGGADSANVLLAASEVHGTVTTVGIEVPGPLGRHQRHRRSALARHVGATSSTILATQHLPFDPVARRRPHSPTAAYYREAFDAMRNHFANEGARVVYLGLGGDEINALHPGERAPATGQVHQPTAPGWLGPRAHAALPELETGVAPVSVVPLPTLQSLGLHNPTYLDAGIWPVAPFAHPILGRLAEQLPVRYRRGKSLFRQRLARAGLPYEVTHPAQPENFLQLMDQGFRTNGLPLLASMQHESVLADGGWVNQAGLIAALDDYERTGHCDARLADLITLELSLRSLQ